MSGDALAGGDMMRMLTEVELVRKVSTVDLGHSKSYNYVPGEIDTAMTEEQISTCRSGCESLPIETDSRPLLDVGQRVQLRSRERDETISDSLSS